METEITVTAISDTHGQVTLPDLLKDHTSDILIHCGDFTAGRTNFLHKSMLSESHKQSWNNFLHELALVRDQFKAVIVVPGNHDQICEAKPRACQIDLSVIGVHLLMNNGVTVLGDGTRGGLRVWGVPHTPPFGQWFFQGHDMAAYTKKIPAMCDVLVSHGPPYSILDTVHPVFEQEGRSHNHLGSKNLYARCQELPSLKAVFFGHIHSSHGKEQRLGVNYFNCSILGERYEIRYEPIVTTIKVDERPFTTKTDNHMHL